MFKEKHPKAKCSYKFFLGYFKDKFTLRFGCPQIDSYCTCEELNLKIRSPHLSDAEKKNAAAELMLPNVDQKSFTTNSKMKATRKQNKMNSMP